MKHYEIRTQCGELVGEGETIEATILAALEKISVNDIIDYCTYGKETTEGIENYSMFELYDLAHGL